MNWFEILQLSPENLDEEQKDELCQDIKWVDVDDYEITIDNLRTIFKITQEVLKYKDDQVEILIKEVNEMSKKHGKEQIKQSLENEMKSFRSSNGSRRHTPDIDIMKENEFLKFKVKSLKTNVELQTQEIEKLKTDNIVLEEEKNMLQSELQSVHHESDSQSEVSEISDKYLQLSESIKQKNKQISQLLSDIEILEKENVVLKKKIITLRDELHEATTSITHTATEISTQKKNLIENFEKINILSEENLALRNQIADLVMEKQNRETELDNFSVALDTKIEELKKHLEEKQSEIQELKSDRNELEKKLMLVSKEAHNVPNSVLTEREEQIEELQLKLVDATKEIEKNTELLNNIALTRKKVTNDMEPDTMFEDLKTQLSSAHKRCQGLQKLLESTEEDARIQGQQLAELMNQLHKYEEGQYGLSDALRELQDGRKQINVRDKQIAELIQSCNKLQGSCDILEYENLTLREKLGLPLDVPVSKNGAISKQRKQNKLIHNLQNQIEVLEEEKLQMKVDLQKYKRQLQEFEAKIVQESKNYGDQEKLSGKKDVDSKKQQITELTEENEALRKGMHEILESIRAKKESSTKEITSETLEKLLHILDARHLTGWYHPAMKLHAEFNTLQGVNEELRNQLRITRLELKKSSEQLKEAENKLQEMQKKLQHSPKKMASIDTNFITSLNVPPNISATSAEIISKLNSHLLIVLNEYQREVENNTKLKEKMESSKQELNVIRHQIGLLYKQYLSEKKLMKSKCEEATSEKEILSKIIDSLQQKLENYARSIENIPEISHVGSKLTQDLIIFNRKCLFLEENEKKLSSENNKLRTEMCYRKTTAAEYIKELEISKNNLEYKIKLLEKALRDSVPKSKMEVADKGVYDLTIKYRDLLQNVSCFKENSNVLIYKKEIELLNSEKDKLFFELLQMKSKNYASVHANDSIDILTKKLANFELNELSERQRADHINRLYELVKEQLRKCEEKCSEYENQNRIILSTNLKFQVAQQELQDQLINCVTAEEFRATDEKLKQAQDETFHLRNKYEKIVNRYNILEAEIKTQEMLKSNQNMEMINMKHLLLDLQSNSDEKALIARLSTEVVLARICESDAKTKLDVLINEMRQINEDRKQKERETNECRATLSNVQNQNLTKFRIMEQLIHFLRTQYLGCNPLSTQERIIETLHQIFTDKQDAFKELQVIQKQKNDIIILQEQLNLEIKNTLELKNAFVKNTSSNAYEKVLEWHREKNTLQQNELKLRRSLEIKETETQQFLQRIKDQDIKLLHLEEELLKISNEFLNSPLLPTVFGQNSFQSIRKLSQESCKSSGTHNPVKTDIGTDPHIVETPLGNKSVEVQTLPVVKDTKQEETILTLQEELKQMSQLVSIKDENLEKQLIFISGLEKNIESLKTLLNENLSEKEHSQRDVNENRQETRQQLNVIDEVDLKEHNALKAMVHKLQLMLTQKEDQIAKYENLLKEGRDEHSLAAVRFQEEIKQLQNLLQEQQQMYQELKTAKELSAPSDLVPNRSAIEQYVNQVHILEGHMADLQTSVSSLNSQLQASRQESVRWRTLANDRLSSIETLRKEFDDQHNSEISMYKSECDNYKEENLSLKQDISKLRVELSQKSSTVNQQLQEKDAKIHELTMTVMQLENDLKICAKEENVESSPQFSEMELAKQLLESEVEALQERFEQISTREKNARAEIRKLKGQLIKRPLFAVRKERSEKSVKEQLQKKIALLEKELAEANEKLEKEAAFNETRKLKIAEDFSQWEKQKRYQQAAEKCKEKLLAKNEELEKLQQSYSSAKSIISRLEREKHILEGKLKVAKNSGLVVNSGRLESMEQENIRLKNEVELLSTKLEMQHYHSGGLGAAMLQEKLEAQERKIAILELSAKGTIEVTAELERLYNTVASLQKANLRLEAENIELNLDFKKASGDVPYLKEQIIHLERYIDVLKSEQSERHVVTSGGDQIQPTNKKVLELEKTVLSLKRLVEKLQVENKRLQSRPCTANSDRKIPSEKLQQELKKIREQYNESVEKSSKLEEELTKTQKRVRFLENVVEAKHAVDANDSSLSTELSDVKAQLARKTQLLDKVKILLQKAAIKEKFLQDQVAQLKEMIPVAEPEQVENGSVSNSGMEFPERDVGENQEN